MQRQRFAPSLHRSLSPCLPVFLLLLAFALRVYRLDFQELRGDEAFGYFFSLRTFNDIVQSTLALKEPHPVASYFVQKIWLNWAGQSEFALRFISVWFGTLAIALLYRLGRRLDLSKPGSLVAMLLLAVSPYAIWHSQDARMYSMSLALTLASTWLAVEWLQKQRWPQTVAYLGVSWLALHTHYFSVFVLAAQAVFVLRRALVLPRLRFTIMPWLGLQGMLAVLYLPWVTQAGGILRGYGGNGDSPTWNAALARALSVFAVGETVPVSQRMGWALLAGVLLLLGGWQLLHNGETGRRALWLLTLYLAIPLLATWYSATQRPLFNERYLIAAAPPFYLLIAALLERDGRLTQMNADRKNWAMGLGSVLVVILLIGNGLSLNRYYTDPAYSKTRGWRGLAGALTRFSAGFSPAQVRLVQNFPDPTLWYYYRGPVDHVVLPPGAHDKAGTRKTVAEFQQKGVQLVILPLQPAPNWDDQQLAANALAATYELVKEQTVGVWPVQIYAQRPVQLTPLNVAFQNGVKLTGSAVQPATLTPGNLLVVHLNWQGDAKRLSRTEKVFVQLLNEAGQLVAQDDRPLAIQTPLATYGILLPEGLPIGAYQLITGLYDPSQTGAPRVATVDGVDFVKLAEIQAAAK
ncbi:MAG: glycosyltransferase family 39 protein [Caldilineaceae bacterium]